MAGPWQLGLAAFAVLLLVLVAGVLGFRGSPRLRDAVEAAELADSVCGGFTAQTVLFDSDRRAALLYDQAGRRVLVFPHGAHFIAREIASGSLQEVEDDSLLVQLATAAITIRLDDVSREAWREMKATA